MSSTVIRPTDVEHSSEPPARRRWFRLATAATAALLAVAAGAVWFALRPDPLFGRDDARLAAAGPASATVPAETVRRIGVAMLMPADGTEARWTQGLDRYLQQVREDAIARCTRAQHVPAPGGPAPSFYRLPFLPDLDRIDRRGFDVLMDGAPAPGSVTPAVERAQQACQRSASALTRPLQAGYLNLQSQWFQAVQALRDGPAAAPEVLRARTAMARCLTDRGIPVRDEEGLFKHVDSQVAEAGSDTEAARRDRQLGRAYAACAAPLEALLTPRRRALREQFLRNHGDEIRSVRDDLDAALQRLRQRTGADLTFPVL